MIVQKVAHISFDFLRGRKYNCFKRVAGKRKSSLPAARLFFCPKRRMRNSVRNTTQDHIGEFAFAKFSSCCRSKLRQ